MTRTLIFLSDCETSFITTVSENPRKLTTKTCKAVNPPLARLHTGEIPNITHPRNKSLLLHTGSHFFPLRSIGDPVSQPAMQSCSTGIVNTSTANFLQSHYEAAGRFAKLRNGPSALILLDPDANVNTGHKVRKYNLQQMLG